MKNYFKIGKIVASHGLTGEMILMHSLGKRSELKGLETIFIENKKDSFLPFFIQNCRAKSETENYISIEDINSKEATKPLLKKEVWLTEEDFNQYAAGAAPISFLGYTICDGKKPIGEIIEVIEQPHQILCKIMLGDKEALIPVHEQSLEGADPKKRLLFVNIPEGLLDIYREG